MSSRCGAAGARPVLQVRAQADVDELDGSRVPGAGVDQQPGLDRAEGHGDVGPDRRAVHRPGVGVDAARQVDGHHGRAGLPGAIGLPGQAGERLPQPAPAADAEQAVDDQVGAVYQVGMATRGRPRAGSPDTRPPAARSAAAPPGCAFGPAAIAVTAAPRRASRAPA